MKEPEKLLPGACKRLGEETFVTMDAFPVSPDQSRVVFARGDLLNSVDGKAMTADETKAFVEEHLLLTLDRNSGIPGSKPLQVYVDRQDDPMNMSLNGNLGSGRAVYYGDCFNLKGLGKTVLAISADRNHSNGNLDLVSAIWEAICSNVLYTNLRTGTSPVLAVINPVIDVEVPWREGKYPGGTIVRIDKHGELDRPTHLFQKKTPVSAERIRQFALNLGRQDAEKFIERILHGCWSAGNVSLDGHLIDYDTVFALRSRAPQWSYRPNWISNFFGMEGQGQKKLLKAMVNDAINADRLSYREVCHLFDSARKDQLERRFLDLVGIEMSSGEIHLPIDAADYSTLVNGFERLSMVMYPNFKATAPWEPDNSSLSLYDLSRFLRLLPILANSGKVERKVALDLIRNPAGRMVESKVSGMPESIESALRKKYVASSDEQLHALDQDALKFIDLYVRLLTAWKNQHPESWQSLMQRAYVVNEERTYMNCRPGNDVVVALTQNLKAEKLDPEGFSLLIQLLIEASDRIPRHDYHGRCKADIRLFMDGYTANLVDSRGYFQPELTILNAARTHESAGDFATSSWELEIDGLRKKCSSESDGKHLHIVGPRLPLIRLAMNDDLEPFCFFKQGVQFNLKQIVRTDR
ncbi:MAG: hypothetical protein KKB51_01745 [Candidatus Riflebacteria bacterium]|nr:hypothetical protein [Candidatus Riflebacteria bacterium]